MPRYHYTAVTCEGKKSKGTITAESPYAARKQLRVRNIHPTNVNEIRGSEDGGVRLFSFLKKSSKGQLIDFTKEMATLLNSGIKLTEALSVMILQTSDAKFKNALTDIRDRVITGESLTDTLKDYTDYFDIIYISMVRVGEVTGSLGANLASIAGFMEKRRKVESKIITAMIYPFVILAFALFVILVLTIKVIPPIAQQIKNTGQELPTITKVLISFSDLLRSWKVVPLILVILLIMWAIKKFLKTDKGAYLKDKTILALPIFGPIIKQRVISRFASTLSALLASGLSMSEALKAVAEVTGNRLMKNAVKQSRERILAGADIATPLRDSGVISPAIAHMVTVAEKSGELENMLHNISENLESQTDTIIERLSAALEPCIIIFVAFLVGIIVLAMLLPILQLSSGI